ncbi:hypothetical protein [Leptolyngbya sp. FACHB-261]|uniref:hypothetical protein n=1 Tax=Leptolyngbya sp. FACHB-261 TaxID=2692806 RepID=UPI001687D0BA|nr:hypothetical protein [Leptolyngbya sp. FACHB-261]MBD2104796.1 hypothetical protein [Leptolyngbya sp. FACHB-261]
MNSSSAKSPRPSQTAFNKIDGGGQRTGLLLVLLITLLGSLPGLWQFWHNPWAIPDDARQHVFWMLRFDQPGLFPNDWIADYFQAVAPPGYTSLYQLANALGLKPLQFNKLLPLGLALISAGYCFSLFWRILPVTWVATLGSFLFVQQALWFSDDVSSGTPRAFFYPIFLPFLDCLAAKRLMPAVLLAGLLALFYPQGALLALGVLALSGLWAGRGPRAMRSWLAFAGALALVGAALLLAKADTAIYEPIVSGAQARTMPEFLPGGRSSFFAKSWSRYWLGGGRSGLMFDLRPPLLALGFLLPLLWLQRSRWPRLQSRLKQMTSARLVLVQVLGASLGLFLLSHALLFRLHLPVRYVLYTTPLLLSIAAAITIYVLIERLGQWQGAGVIGLLLLSLWLCPYRQHPVKTGTIPEIYQFLRQTPVDTLTASLTLEADNLPSFAQRSVLTSGEYSIPYQLGYYQRLRQRTVDLITAQYATDASVIQNFLNRYEVDYWLVEDNAFKPSYLKHNSWLRQYQAVAEAAENNLTAQASGQGRLILPRLVKTCTVQRQKEFTLLAANCLNAALEKSQPSS